MIILVVWLGFVLYRNTRISLGYSDILGLGPLTRTSGPLTPSLGYKSLVRQVVSP